MARCLRLGYPIHAELAFCVRFNFELQAAATDDAVVLSLANDFPALRALVGAERFAHLAAVYTDAHFSVRYFGQHLHAFLASSEDFRNEPWLSELAASEWQLGEAFDAAHAPPLTAELLAELAPAAWPNIGLALHPSVRRLDLGWNVDEIWQAADRHEPPGTSLAYPHRWRGSSGAKN